MQALFAEESKTTIGFGGRRRDLKSLTIKKRKQVHCLTAQKARAYPIGHRKSLPEEGGKISCCKTAEGKKLQGIEKGGQKNNCSKVSLLSQRRRWSRTSVIATLRCKELGKKAPKKPAALRPSCVHSASTKGKRSPQINNNSETEHNGKGRGGGRRLQVTQGTKESSLQRVGGEVKKPKDPFMMQGSENTSPHREFGESRRGPSTKPRMRRKRCRRGVANRKIRKLALEKESRERGEVQIFK